MNKEKLEIWALIAEIIGGFAILVTLVLLVVEVSENTSTLKANTYDSLVADLGEWRLGNARNDYIPTIRGPFSELSEVEQLRVRDSIVSLFFIFERAFIQWRVGNLDDDAWERFHRSVCSVSLNPEFERNFGYAIDQVTTKDFENYRKTACAGGS